MIGGDIRPPIPMDRYDISIVTEWKSCWSSGDEIPKKLFFLLFWERKKKKKKVRQEFLLYL